MNDSWMMLLMLGKGAIAHELEKISDKVFILIEEAVRVERLRRGPRDVVPKEGE